MKALDMNFDYSCISSLYYQSIEYMYNQLLWREYAKKLNHMKHGRNSFSYLYKNKMLPESLYGFLPKNGEEHYWDKECKQISLHLSMGSFRFLFYNLRPSIKSDIPRFNEYADKCFDHANLNRVPEEYDGYKSSIELFYSKFDLSVPRRNKASHGEEKVSLGECVEDRNIVLSPKSESCQDSLGLIQLFLSLYR